MLTIDEARQLMEEWTESEALRVHMECVALCMRGYARRLAAAEEDRWVIAGLLHDYDYEKHPTQEEHPMVGVQNLERIGVDEEIRRAILAHAEYTGTPRDTLMAKTLFAVDELAGFIVACVKVRPNGITDLGAKSVKKKLKDKAFAAAVNRDDIRRGVEELGVDLSEHITLCIESIRADGERLGLTAR